jgi:hypothetical protein
MKVSWASLLLITVLASLPASTQLPSPSSQTAPAAKVALTPPMGWNSWDAYGLTITEDQFRANVKVEANELKSFGWNYAVIDEGWFFFNPEDRPKPDTLHYAIDEYGRYVPVPERFPSSGKATVVQMGPSGPHPAYKLPITTESTSFKPLADWVHSQGLKFGIHIVRGIPRASVERNLHIFGSSFDATDAADTSDACPWDPTNWGVKNNAAGQAWYDSLFSQYADWGVDLIKVDCIASHPYKIDEIRMIRRAIDKTGRPMVLSLSPGPTSLDNAAEVANLAQMWRISDDFWDVWSKNNDNGNAFPQSVVGQFAKAAAWAQYAKPGNWPDADMLPIGELRPVPGDGQPRTTRLTHTEQQTMLGLWAMARSPLILGANLALLDDATLKLLSNTDLIRIDQTATRSGQVMHDGDIIAWTADLPADSPDGSIALALFNTGEIQVVLDSSFEAYNLDAATYRVKDVWTGKTVNKVKSVQSLTLEPHACVLWLLKK